MSWQCGCGVTNGDFKWLTFIYRANCRACGTPKGMVWSPEGFRAPTEAELAAHTASKTLPYTGGIFWILIITIPAGVNALLRAPQAPLSSVLVALSLGLLAMAAVLRKPWGWYVLLVVNLLGFISFSALGVYAFFFALLYQVMGDPSPFFAFVAVLNVSWFVYFYRRRSMFGAKGRWRWYERTFPRLVGPEE